MERPVQRLLGVFRWFVSTPAHRMPVNRAALLTATIIVFALNACATNQKIITGTPLPPISSNKVKIYSHPPESFKEIAILNASKNDLLGLQKPQSNKAIIEQLKRSAASLGANGILIRSRDHKRQNVIGSGYGVDGSTATSSKSREANSTADSQNGLVHAVAIYVLDEEQ